MCLFNSTSAKRETMVLFKLKGTVDESLVVNVRGAKTTSEAIDIGK